MSQPISSPPVRVWDLFVRIFHWSLVACVFLNFLVEEGEAPHQWIGYAASALVAARGWSIKEMDVERGRLDEVFRALTRGEAA